MELNEKIFKLNSEGLKPAKIAMKLKIKKAVVLDILGDAANKGLGTIIEAVTEATGIKAIVEALVDDCGCAARAEKLNKAFPLRKLNDLSIEDNDYLTGFFKTNNSYVSSKEQRELVEVYNRIFNSKRVVSNCSPCVVNLIKELKDIHGAAND